MGTTDLDNAMSDEYFDICQDLRAGYNNLDDSNSLSIPVLMVNYLRMLQRGHYFSTRQMKRESKSIKKSW